MNKDLTDDSKSIANRVIDIDAGDLVLLTQQLSELVTVVQQNNDQSEVRRTLAEKQYQQSVLNYEQTERQYLIEKSKMQPSFRLSVTEFLMCKPDFMNDPEQASEAKYLENLGVSVDERVLRLKIHVKGEAEYFRPNIVINQLGVDLDERAYSMTELICFIQAGRIDMPKGVNSTLLYLVYRDKTTLPVIHKYRLTQQQDSALRRWDANHIDTVYVQSHENLSGLNNSINCAEFFSGREES